MTTLSLAEEPAVKELFSIPEDWAVATLVPMGKPVKQLTRLKRKPVSELAVMGDFSGPPLPGVVETGSSQETRKGDRLMSVPLQV